MDINTKKTKVLFIKLENIGDVIRTTPLLEKFRSKYGDCHFTWVTHTPQVTPKNDVDLIFQWNESSVSYISKQSFDIAINLDKDKRKFVYFFLLLTKKIWFHMAKWSHKYCYRKSGTQTSYRIVRSPI